MHKVSIRQKAHDLRKAGYSYTHIARETGVTKSTLSDWLTMVPYQPNAETTERIGRAIASANAKKTSLKLESIEAIRKEASKEMGQVSKRDLFMFGLGLYLGEGAKTGDLTRLVNADPTVIRLAIAWFHSLGVIQEQFLLTLHLYPDSNITECLQFWSTATTIPLSQFGKVQIDVRKNKKTFKNGKLPYGTAHLSVRSLGRKEFGVALARKIKGWTDAVSERVVNAGLV